MSTLTEITEKKEEITAINTAYLQSLSTGSVTEFEQGSTRIVKASTQELRRMLNQAKNELVIMEGNYNVSLY